MKIVAILFLTFSIAQGVIYTCTYSNKNWAVVGTLYGCTVSSIAVGTSLDVENVLGNLLSGKSLEDVEAFSVTRKPVKELPSNLADFFPNLKGIQLYSVEFAKISMEDLRPFPKLEFLNLATNLLTSLPGDLFKFNPNLKLLYVYSNDLVTVGQGVLDGLNFLANVDFTLNPCINLNGQTTEKIEILKEELLQKCLPVGETIAPRTVKSTLATTTKPLSTFSTTPQTTLPPITTTESCPHRCSLDDEMDELTRNIDSLTVFTEQLKDELEALKTNYGTLQAETKKNKEKITELEKRECENTCNTGITSVQLDIWNILSKAVLVMGFFKIVHDL